MAHPRRKLVHGGAFKGKPVWSFGIYVQDKPFTTESRLEQPVKLFSSMRIKMSARHPSDQADPMLIAEGPALHIFYEELLPRGVGKIACARTSDLVKFEKLGVVLSEPHHLSYPFVFRDGADTFLLPEAKQSSEVSLYRFDSFPFEPRKVRALVSGAYVDPFLLNKDGMWYLFATSNRGLEVFFAEDFRRGNFKPHPLNPVTTDPRYSRNGGGPLWIHGSLYRVAQDCSETYGRNVSLIEIDDLSPQSYQETVARYEFFERADRWNRLGAHHLSVEKFLGKTVIAADGYSRDFRINNLLARLFW